MCHTARPHLGQRSPRATTDQGDRVGLAGRRGILPKNADLKLRETGMGGGTWVARSPLPLGTWSGPIIPASVGTRRPDPTAPPGSDQFCDPTSSSANPVPTSGTFRTALWRRDPWVALAVKCDNPPLVWGTCSLHNALDNTTINIPFLIDTGADVTVFPEANWPPHWKLKNAPMVGGVGGLSRARKSARLVAITLHTEKGPEKTITLFPLVMSGVPLLLGRDALALLKAKVTNL